VGGARIYRDATGIEEHTVSQIDRTREHLIETYRKKAKHYDITSRLYPVPGYPQRAQRLRAVQALGLRAGGSVVDLACGTGLNFPLIQEMIGPGGRIVGVDLTDAMLARAQDRIETNGWSNISLVQADAQRSSPTAPRPSPEADAGSCWISRFPTTRLGG
jgi:ubiquinone/menaquinone biosynthesis C-methylase UbiE